MASVPDRSNELQRFAEQRSVWRSQRREVLRALASRLEPGEEIVELRAGQDDRSPELVLVTDSRVLISRQEDVTAAATHELVPFTEILAADPGSNVAGSLVLTTAAGTVTVSQLSARDAEILLATIRPRLRRTGRSFTRRRDRRPVTDLEMLESLRRSGVLTEHEFLQVRDRVLQQVAVKFSATIQAGDLTE